MDYKVFINQKDVTAFIGGLNWGSNIDTLSSQLSFAWNKVTNNPQLGDNVIFTNGKKTIFIGVITNITDSQNSMSITANDFAWYLNKNKAFHQFRKVSITDAIKQLCNKYGIQIDSIITMPRIVTKIYTDAYVSDIINELLDLHRNETGKAVAMEMIGGKLRIYLPSDELIDPRFKPAINLEPVRCFDYMGKDYSITESIEEMVNNVQIIQGEKIVTTTSNKDAIKRYGMLSETITVDGTNIAQAKHDAQTIIDTQSKIPQELSVTVMGSDEIIAGRSVILNMLDGKRWLIKSVSHTFNGIHMCSVTLGKEK